MHYMRLLAIIGFIVIGIINRLLPHPPNFVSIHAMTLFSAFYLGNPYLSFAIAFSTLLFSDIILGFHSTMPFVYLSFGLITLLGYWLKNKRAHYFPLASLISSLLFFLVTNFGVWINGTLYPKTAAGLGCCYIAALPFLTHQILGDLVYSALLFGFWKLTFQSKNTLDCAV